MGKKIMINANSSNEAELLKRQLESHGFDITVAPRDGDKLLELIASRHPDVVVCEAFMKGRDAVGVLHELSGKQNRPFVLVTASTNNSFVEQEIMKNGADYFMLKPFNVSVLAHILKEMTSNKGSCTRIRVGGQPSLEQEVTEMIHQIGVPAHIKGYHYLRDSIILCVNDRDKINAVTKVLYPEVAKHYQTTPSRVERAIRHAIEVAWDRGDVDVLNSYFGYTIHNGRGKPTNSEFVAMISDKIRLQQGDIHADQMAR